MKYRIFGRTNWKFSEIGYGMWGMVGCNDIAERFLKPN